MADIAYVDAGRTAAKEAGGSSSEQHEEEKLCVRCSYSTKVRITYFTYSSNSISGTLPYPHTVGASLQSSLGLSSALHQGATFNIWDNPGDLPALTMCSARGPLRYHYQCCLFMQLLPRPDDVSQHQAVPDYPQSALSW